MPKIRLGAFSRVGQDNIAVDPTKIAIKRGLGLFATLGKDNINSINVSVKKGLGSFNNIGQDNCNTEIEIKKAIHSYIEVSNDDFFSDLRLKRSLSTNTCIVGNDNIQLITIIRDVLGDIPTGQIYLLTESGEKPLNNQSLHRGDSNILNIYLEGDRIVPIAIATKGSMAGMNLTFTAKSNPHDPDEKAVIKKSLKQGHLYFNGIREINNYKGTVKKASYQLMILPNDTNKLIKTEILYYDLQLDSGVQNGEKYTLEGRKGEKFTVNYDLWRS